MRLELSFDRLLAWFATEKRSFPWRIQITPYSVLVSEVMLQQTQASRVVSYFSRWMEKFPTIVALAQTAEEEVIKAWEGLGYYSRALALHHCAKIICDQYGGIIPSVKEDLLQLPGIGPYTAGAIVAFAYHQRAEAIDANVRRVFSRMVKGCFENGIEGSLEKALPETKPWEAMEALIELGALVCSKIPHCDRCPYNDQCYAYTTGRIEELTRHKKSARILLYRDVAVFVCHFSVLVQRVTKPGLMLGLYQFPYFSTTKGGTPPSQFLSNLMGKRAADMTVVATLPKVQHSFTKYQAHLYPHIILCKEFECPEETGDWVSIDKVHQLPFSSGHRRVLLEFLQQQRG